jgi:hypothetical protein
MICVWLGSSPDVAGDEKITGVVAFHGRPQLDPEEFPAWGVGKGMILPGIWLLVADCGSVVMGKHAPLSSKANEASGAVTTAIEAWTGPQLHTKKG